MVSKDMDACWNCMIRVIMSLCMRMGVCFKTMDQCKKDIKCRPFMCEEEHNTSATTDAETTAQTVL